MNIRLTYMLKGSLTPYEWDLPSHTDDHDEGFYVYRSLDRTHVLRVARSEVLWIVEEPLDD